MSILAPDRIATLITLATHRGSPISVRHVLQRAVKAAAARADLDADWQITRAGLTRRFTFADRRQCAAFVAALARDANTHNHHPDVVMADNGVTVTYVTHSADNTITDLDYAAAKRADALSTPYRAAIDKPRAYASTQIQLPPTLATELFALGRAIPDADLADDGRETDAHITVQYGLHTDRADDVAHVLRGLPPIAITLGPTAMFAADDHDVVFVRVTSPMLHHMHARLGAALAVTDTHPIYQPHATIAYVKSGRGQRYVGNTALAGAHAVVNAVLYKPADPDAPTVSIALRPAVKAAAAVDTELVRVLHAAVLANNTTVIDQILGVRHAGDTVGHEFHGQWKPSASHAEFYAKNSPQQIRLNRDAIRSVVASLKQRGERFVDINMIPATHKNAGDNDVYWTPTELARHGIPGETYWVNGYHTEDQQRTRGYDTQVVLPTIRTAGGAGSGNFGHSGRKGEVGGSGNTGTDAAPHADVVTPLPHASGLTALLDHTDGGFSYNAVTGEQPTSGLILSIHPERKQTLAVADVSLETLTAYAIKNADLLTQAGQYFGAWNDAGTVYLDVSTIVHDVETAERLCRAANQLAYFDLDQKITVRIGDAHAKAAAAASQTDTALNRAARWATNTRRLDCADESADAARSDTSRDPARATVAGLTVAGGAGSGNFGHAGRKGEVGGSASKADSTAPAAVSTTPPAAVSAVVSATPDASAATPATPATPAPTTLTFGVDDATDWRIDGRATGQHFHTITALECDDAEKRTIAQLYTTFADTEFGRLRAEIPALADVDVTSLRLFGRSDIPPIGGEDLNGAEGVTDTRDGVINIALLGPGAMFPDEVTHAPVIERDATTGIVSVHDIPWGVNPSREGILRHELGHMVHGKLFHDSDTLRAWYTACPGPTEAATISYYATSSEHEAFAEAFNLYVSPGTHRSLPPPMQTFMETYLPKTSRVPSVRPS